MMNLSNIDAVLRKIPPESVARFLTSRGYNRDGGNAGSANVYSHPSGELLVVPTDRASRDYARRLRDIVELFVSARSTVDDVVGRMVLPDSDVLRYRVETPETTWGQMRLHYTHEAMHAIYDLLQYSAAGVSSKRTDYLRVSKAAKSYAEQCRFGQTEYGSFVLKVFVPVDPIQAKDDVGEPFGRQSTQAVIENLDFLSSDRCEDPSEPLPPTLNRQVASAVHRLKPREQLGVSTHVRVSYSPLVDDAGLVPQPQQDDRVSELDLGPFIFSRAQSVRDRLKNAEEFEAEILTGFIETLHKERPMRDTEQSHEVILDVKFGSSRRKLRVRLLPRQYRNAMHWHDANTEVVVDAVIDKRSKVWSVFSLNDLRARDASADAAGLFDQTS